MLLLSSIDVRLIPVYTGSSYYQYLCKHYVLSVPTERTKELCAWTLFIRQTKLMVFGAAELVRPSAVLYTLPV